jgi:hypothetical protein
MRLILVSNTSLTLLIRPGMALSGQAKPANDDPVSDIHRFFEQTGTNYINGRANDSLADPFMALSIIPTATQI